MKFGINTTLVVLEMVNFTRLRLMKFIPISNTTLVIFIPNFTATHAITSTNLSIVHIAMTEISISIAAGVDDLPCFIAFLSVIPISLHLFVYFL